jgi:hypothetical protein
MLKRKLILAAGPATLLSGEQLSAMAAHFIRLLCELKHSGAIDKAQQGFAALCEVLFQHHDPALRQLPQRCMRQLLAYLRRPGQGPRDIVRRSGEHACGHARRGQGKSLKKRMWLWLCVCCE